MPQFDFIPRPVQTPNAVRGVADDTALRIQQQGRQALSQGVDKLALGFNQMRKNQDEADMVASRSAVLRIQADENAELAGLSNKDDIKAVQEKYKKMYDGVIGGKDPLNNKPYFRNESGKNAFNQGFMQNFHTQRYAQGKKLETELDRRDTHAKYMNGIKSIINQPNWNTPEAHAETDIYVNELIEGGFYTAEEGKAFRETTHTNLDIERANKMFANVQTFNYDEANDGRLYKKTIDEYKESVNDLGYLDQAQKNDYIKKADALFKQKSMASKIRIKEMEANKKKMQLDADAEVALGIQKGTIPLHQAVEMPNISMEYRTTLYKQFNEQTKKSKEAFLEGQMAYVGSLEKATIENNVYSYDPAQDRMNGYKKRTALQLGISQSSMSADEKSRLQKILVDGLPMDEEAKAELKAMEEQMSMELGIGQKLDKSGKLSDLQEQLGFEKETKEVAGRVYGTRSVDTGDLVKDGLNTAKRSRLYSSQMGRVRELMKRGKIDEARTAFSEAITKLQKYDDDLAFYNETVNQYFRVGKK